MEITRNTMRADGLTVGEAMDKDAAFLRSIGIDAKDGQPTFDEKKQAYIDKVEAAVLEALDSAAGGRGYEDKDLPRLLPAIRKHAEVLFFRSSNL